MKKNLFLIAVATAVVAACSSDLNETSVVESCPVRLCTDGLTGMTRAGQSVQLTQFAANQQVGIFLAEDNGSNTPVTSGTNVTTYDQPLTYVANGSGGLTNLQFWPQDGNGLHIFGVYPLAAATAAADYSATDVSFSVQADQSTNPDESIGDANYMLSDLMTGVPTEGNPVARTDQTVPLTFTHLLTKIDVSLTAGSGFTQAELADAVVSILGTKPTTTFNVQNATVGTASGDATTIIAGTGAATSAIIVPQALDANASFIQVTVGGGNYIYKLPAATTFAAKTCYTYSLTVNKTGLVLTVTTITPWTYIATVTGTAELQLPKTDISTFTGEYTAKNGEILTGTLANYYVKICIADGATVTLDNVNINGNNNLWGEFAGITCIGDATIILSGTNTVRTFYEEYPGIYVPWGRTLTIQGEGSLTAVGDWGGAGIGGGYQLSCGNINIEGGNITASGHAGIGGSYESGCGYINISGGTVNATGTSQGAGIGGGNGYGCGNITISGGTVVAQTNGSASAIGGGYDTDCGSIVIGSNVESVTAIGGYAEIPSIGSGQYWMDSNCTVTFGNKVMDTEEGECELGGYTLQYNPALVSGSTYGGLILTISNDGKTWTLVPATP